MPSGTGIPAINSSNVSVTAAGAPCYVREINTRRILCITTPAAQLQVRRAAVPDPRKLFVPDNENAATERKTPSLLLLLLGNQLLLQKNSLSQISQISTRCQVESILFGCQAEVKDAASE